MPTKKPASKAKFKEVASGLKFPEGPVVMADGSVIVVEIYSGDVTRVLPDGRKQRVAHVGGGPNGAAIGPDGALYVCNNGGFSWTNVQGLLLPGHQAEDYKTGSIQRVDLATGKVDVLYTDCDGRQLSGPNDLVFDQTGGFWFTDHAKSTGHHRVHGGLYYAKADGSHISCAVHEIHGPNGVGLSPDEKTVYYAETYSGRLFAAKLGKPGQLASGGGLLPGGTYVGQTPGYSLYDSLAVQANGDVCVATLLNPGISTISPKGKVTFTSLAKFQDPLVTNIAFGGKDMKTAWITVSGRGLLLQTAWPKPGLALAFNA